MKKVIFAIRDFISNLIARIALFLVFIFVIIPTKFVMVLCRRDRLRLNKQSDSYWINSKEENNYELQY